MKPCHLMLILLALFTANLVITPVLVYFDMLLLGTLSLAVGVFIMCVMLYLDEGMH